MLGCPCLSAAHTHSQQLFPWCSTTVLCRCLLLFHNNFLVEGHCIWINLAVPKSSWTRKHRWFPIAFLQLDSCSCLHQHTNKSSPSHHSMHRYLEKLIFLWDFYFSLTFGQNWPNAEGDEGDEHRVVQGVQPCKPQAPRRCSSFHHLQHMTQFLPPTEGKCSSSFTPWQSTAKIFLLIRNAIEGYLTPSLQLPVVETLNH